MPLYFSPDHKNATPEPEPLGRNQRCLLLLKYVGDCASVITTGRNYYIMSLTGGGKSRRMDDRVVLYYEHSSQGWPTTALITTRLLTNTATFYQQMYVLWSKVDWESGWQRMFNNTTQVVKQGAEDFTVGFDSGRGVTTISNVCETTQPLSRRFLGNKPLWRKVFGAKIKQLLPLQYVYRVEPSHS